jgi:hypothetical protein
MQLAIFKTDSRSPSSPAYNFSYYITKDVCITGTLVMWYEDEPFASHEFENLKFTKKDDIVTDEQKNFIDRCLLDFIKETIKRYHELLNQEKKDGE